MAKIFQEKGDPRWYLDYIDNNGKRHRPVTSTTSKGVAQKLLAEVVAQLERQRLGLEIIPTSQVKTMGEAWEKWLNEWCTPAMREIEQHRYNGNVRDSWFANKPIREVTPKVVDQWLQEKLDGKWVGANGEVLKEITTQSGRKRKVKPQSPSYVNGHRAIIKLVFNKLIDERLFIGVNPVDATKPVEEPERAYDLLSEPDFLKALEHVNDDWKDICRVAFYTGLRRGEIYALRKDRAVIDLEKETITPRRSNLRKTTKGKKVKTIPLTAEAIEPLKRAWARTKYGELLFPTKDGKMRSKHLRPADIIRSAMARAGLVEGWNHVCRWGCKVEQHHPDEQQRKCPECGRILYPKAIVRQVRFHDLRHSIITHLLDSGVDISVASRFARHSDMSFTDKHYAHRTVEAIRDAITPKSVEDRLLELEKGQPPAVAALLAETRRKLALNWHPDSNVVPLRAAGDNEK